MWRYREYHNTRTPVCWRRPLPCIRWLCAGYSARTAVYLLQRLGAHHLKIHDLTSLRLLGIMAINIAAWNLHHEHVGKRESAVVDTFW